MKWVRDELAAWEQAGLLRNPRVIDTASAPEVEIDGRRVVLLCSNNYLGLADDPRLRDAAANAARRWGAGTGASRLVSGNSRLHRDLELQLAAFEGTDDVVLFSSGYLANIGAITTITGPEDVVFSDELNHASIVDACRLSRARIEVYRHADLAHLAQLFYSAPARRRVVVTDTVFSMDGDLAPLKELEALCAERDAMLVVDEAHATGVLGRTGAGATEELGVRPTLVVGTLSKALGSAGGYVATSSDLAMLIRNRARTHVFDTAPAPATLAAAMAALRIVEGEPWRRERVRSQAHRFAAELRALGYEVGQPAAAFVPVIVGDARGACELSDRLLEQGVFCPAIRPPSVPEGTSRLRVTLMATHTDEQLDRALQAFAGINGRTSSRPQASQRRRDLFVTGTDTGVGKTIVTAVIAKTLASSGLSVAIFKPFQTGTIDGDDDARDAARLSGCDAYTGVTFPDPLAPSVAAELAGEEIDMRHSVETFRDLQARYDAVIVEGAGGLLVPITGAETMAELARALELPIVIVARPALGTLNHTALTVEAARARGLHVEGIVISGFPASPTTAEATNPQELEKLCGAPLIGIIPFIDDLDDLEATPWLAPELGGSFDRETFLGQLSRSPVT